MGGQAAINFSKHTSLLLELVGPALCVAESLVEGQKIPVQSVGVEAYRPRWPPGAPSTPAARPWLARLALEGRDVALADMQLAAAALGCLRGRRHERAEKTLLRLL